MWLCKANVNQFKPMQHLPKSAGCFNVSSFAKQQMKEAYRLRFITTSLISKRWLFFLMPETCSMCCSTQR